MNDEKYNALRVSLACYSWVERLGENLLFNQDEVFPLFHNAVQT